MVKQIGHSKIKEQTDISFLMIVFCALLKAAINIGHFKFKQNIDNVPNLSYVELKGNIHTQRDGVFART